MPEKPVSAIDYISQPDKYPPRPVCALFGGEAFLRRQSLLLLRAEVLGGDDGEFSLSSFDGRDAVWRDVAEALATVAMFGGGRRMALVEDADEFVSRYRPQLEEYVARPSRTGVLALELDSLPSNTRLYKAILSAGLAVECAPPQPAKLFKWLIDWAKKQYGVQLQQAAVEAMVESVGTEIGLLDQELAKLALLVGADKKITPELVSKAVGGWRTRTTWDMLDAALDGNLRDALLQLDRLLAAGEQPVGLLGQISASLRRFAAATRLVIQAETAGRRPNLRNALEQAGVRSFVLQKTERQLRLLGRRRGEQLLRWLLQADMDLKGDSAMPPRLILERLIVRLGAPQVPAQPRT